MSTWEIPEKTKGKLEIELNQEAVFQMIKQKILHHLVISMFKQRNHTLSNPGNLDYLDLNNNRQEIDNRSQ